MENTKETLEATKGGSLPGLAEKKEGPPMPCITCDTETGGLYPSVHALLSIGACCSWSLERFSGYITPESQPGKVIIDLEAARVNGYTPERWKLYGAMSYTAVFGGFIDWLRARKKERPGALLVCHNLAFDMGFLREGERLTGHELPHRSQCACTQLELVRLMKAGLIAEGSASLDRLRVLSGWEGARNAEHDALDDALITEHGYQWLIGVAKRPEMALRALYHDSLNQRRSLENLISEVERTITP